MRKFFLFFVGVGLIAHGWIGTGIVVLWCSLSMEPEA